MEAELNVDHTVELAEIGVSSLGKRLLRAQVGERHLL